MKLLHKRDQFGKIKTVFAIEVIHVSIFVKHRATMFVQIILDVSKM